MDDDERTAIGRRLREVRYWRRKSQRAVAELAGSHELITGGEGCSTSTPQLL